MNFSGSGWLWKYLKYRKTKPFPNRLPSAGVKVLEEAGHHHELDEAIYYFLQPTGLLYGFPVALPFPEEEPPNMHFMGTSDKGHLIFMESMLACLVADRAFLLEGLVDEPDHFPQSLATAVDYFAGSADPLKRSRIPLLGRFARVPSAERRFEKEIGWRIAGSQELIQLPGFHHNSFLFLDLYSCLLWQRKMLMDPSQREVYLLELKESRTDARRQLIRLMIAAAQSSGKISSQERKLIEWFLKSSRLPRKDCQILRKELKQGLRLEDIQLRETPWLVRRFFLEAVMMITLIDRDLSPEEERFLARVVEKLELWEEELGQGMMALEVFLMQQGESLQILKDRHMVFNVGQNLREKGALMIRKNMSRIVNEIEETKDLYNLLMKSTRTALTQEEKERVKEQLSDILKTIPALAIFALPGGGVILPIVIKLLPFNLLPSSFED